MRPAGIQGTSWGGQCARGVREMPPSKYWMRGFRHLATHSGIMAPTKFGLFVRQQAWFRAHLDVEGLPRFDTGKIDSLSILQAGAFRARVLVGRGPVEHGLGSEVFLWFDHGKQEYPVFQSPSIGPPGAGLHMSSRPRTIIAAADEALCLIEVSVVQPVDHSFAQAFEQQSQPDQVVGPGLVVRDLQSACLAWLEQTIGLYALYQYPLVWEPLGLFPVVGFVDLASQSFRVATRIEPDNLIPFRLRVGERLAEGQLSDQVLAELGRLRDTSLHLPLLLLQRSLWQRNIELRFLETFLMLDYMAGQFDFQDAGREERQEFYSVLEAFVQDAHPKQSARIAALKHIILQVPLRQRLQSYLQSLGLSVDDEGLGRMLKLRNDLAHARQIDKEALKQTELEVRQLAREVMRKELAALGMSFEVATQSPSAPVA
jgi:hypothetical protein